MNVSGVNPSAGIYNYNSIRLSELRNRQIPAAEEQTVTEHEDVLQEQTYTAYDYAKEYRAGETYEQKGEDADINQLDVAKAVSDLEKDKILQQYQYFVGGASYFTSKENALEVPIHLGENFVL